jgi:hypothetical protein
MILAVHNCGTKYFDDKRSFIFSPCILNRKRLGAFGFLLPGERIF